MLVPLLVILFLGNSSSAKAQEILPSCDSYKNENVVKYKIKTIEVYDSKRKLKIAYYKFDKEGYLLRLDTLVHIYDTFPSQKTYVHYLNNRSLIIDSTINLSFNHQRVPPRSMQYTILQCLPGKKEIQIYRYNLGSRKDSVLRLYLFNCAGNMDTIYRIDVYEPGAGRRQVESYFDYRPGTSPLVFDSELKHLAWITRNWQYYHHYYYDSLNRIRCEKHMANRVTYSYNTDNLLVEKLYDFCDLSGFGRAGFYCGNLGYFKGKEYDSQRTLYFYSNNKLVKSVDFACKKTIETGGNIQYETLGAIQELTYEYNSRRLLSRINKPEATLVFKYTFYK
jgi:hypothetical protein